MANTIFLCGVPGVGKTYLLSSPKIIKTLADSDYELVGMGSVMFKIALDKMVVEDRDGMRELDRETQMELQRLAAEEINNRYVERNKNVVVDTHASVLTPEGYLGTFSVWVADEINIDTIVLVEAKPSDILERRMKDTSRRRNALEDEIIQHQDFNRAVVAAYTTFSTARALILDNSTGRAEEAQNRLLRVL